MNTAPILQYPHTLLQAKTQRVDVKEVHTKEFNALIERMLITMRKQRGIGIAAPQIGDSRRVAVIEMKDGPFVMVNPVLTDVSKKTEVDEEGCLSVSGVFGHVSRANKVTLHALNRSGLPFSLVAKGFFARVIQHEVDHLDGILFVQRCSFLTAGIERAVALGLTIPHRHDKQ